MAPRRPRYQTDSAALTSSHVSQALAHASGRDFGSDAFELPRSRWYVAILCLDVALIAAGVALWIASRG